jgi:hypothetical protein
MNVIIQITNDIQRGLIKLRQCYRNNIFRFGGMRYGEVNVMVGFGNTLMVDPNFTEWINVIHGYSLVDNNNQYDTITFPTVNAYQNFLLVWC